MRATVILALLAGAAGSAGAEPLSDVRANYLFSCRGCHLADGRGVPPHVPTLRDELGPIVAQSGGKEYLVRVPGVLQSRLDDRALAEVLNYVLTEFNRETLPADFKPYTRREVAEARQRILADPVAYRRAMLGGSTFE
jgi:mono/diheme cytochrome c family protein